ncbi:MAG: LysR family transcriptional regulator [Selenomonadaceae bacterium]|nr:LysR family transcriptional regulator [Selenomonadaceae bacterium]
MELTQLKYFQALARHKNFTQAAKSISVSQSALSRSIAKLEQELGAPLLNRHGKETELTEAGEKFLFHVDRVLREMDVARQEIKMDNGGEGTVSVSFLHSLGDTYLPLILSRFHARYPHVGIKLNQQNSAVMSEEIMEGDTDICLCSMLNGDDIAWMYLWSEELFLVVPDSHPLAQRETVRLEEVDGEPFITLKTEYNLRQQVNQLLDLAESQPQVIFEGDEVHNLISLVAAKLGVSLLPHIPCTEQMGVSYLPVSFPACKRAVGIAWNTRRPLTPAAIRFQQFTINYFRDHQDAE